MVRKLDNLINKIKVQNLILILLVLSFIDSIYQSYLKKEYIEHKNILVKQIDYKNQLTDSLKAIIMKKKISIIIKEYNKELQPYDIKELANLIYEESVKLDFDPLFVTSIIVTESEFKTNAKSHKGALGLMQLKPSTAKYIASLIGYEKTIRKTDLFNYKHNVKLGIEYLKYLVKRFDGDLDLATIAYNLGEYKVVKKRKNGEKLPKKYLLKVNKKYKNFKNRFENELNNFL